MRKNFVFSGSIFKSHVVIRLALCAVVVWCGAMAGAGRATARKLVSPRIENSTVLPIPSAPPNPTFTAVESMAVARWGPTATLLNDGTVLVAGGSTGFALVNTGELFDPRSGAFGPAANTMAKAHLNHTATLLPTGKVLITGGYNDVELGPTAAVELFDPRTRTFTSGNPMSVARYQHTATLLRNGKVLITGGYDGEPATNKAELFDPISETFTSVAPMITARYGHTATLLQDGRILITGGNAAFSGVGGLIAATNRAELFDPATNTFTAIAATMTTPRYFHTATALPTGQVLITGGLDGLATGSINTAELFDPATQTFTTVSPMNEPRAFHSSTLLPSGDVLITGGTVSLAAISSTAELFNPTANTFTTVTNMMVQPRYSHTATLLPSGQILLAGGVNNGSLATNTAELCDPTAGAENFRSLLPTTMNSARYNTAATLLPDGNVLITGGADQQAVLNTAELFNPSSETFAVLANTMNSPRFIHSATLLGNGKVLIAGGYTNQPSNTAELFDPGSETFTSVVSTMTTPRYWHSATLLPNGKVLLAGGYNGSGSTNSADLFDPASATFVSLPPMHFARQAHSATLLEDGKVLIAGGYTLNGATNSAELFDPVSETFTLLSPNTMSVPRFYHTATLLPSGQVLLTGGSTGSGFSNTAELFDPVSQTFTALSNTMKLSRYWHTAAQLSTGKVLIVGGYSDAGASLPLVITNTAELFDPATETFTLVSSTMSNGRANGNTATLLANGEVLVAGGLDGNTIAAETANNTADLFDSGLGFSDAERPVVSTVSSPLFLPVHFALTGSGFQGDSEASDSSYSASATNYPLLQLTRIDNEQSFFVFSDPSNPWSARSFSSQTLSSLPTGFYRLKVFANAIPSLDQLISIKTAPPAQLTGVVSRKSHGNAATFDVDLTAGDGIECRSGGANGDYTLVFSFTNTLTGVVNAGVTTGVGSVATSNIDSNDAHNYIVNLTGVANAQVITVSLSDVSDSAGDFSPAVSIQMAILLGDVNSSRRVDAADVSLVRQQTLQPLTSSNFRADINTSGRIDAADVSIARQQTLTSVP